MSTCELQYHDYSIAVMSLLLVLALMHVHVPNLVATLGWCLRRMNGTRYSEIT
jgi:hypothetical protein